MRTAPSHPTGVDPELIRTGKREKQLNTSILPLCFVVGTID